MKWPAKSKVVYQAIGINAWMNVSYLPTYHPLWDKKARKYDLTCGSKYIKTLNMIFYIHIRHSREDKKTELSIWKLNSKKYRTEVQLRTPSPPLPTCPVRRWGGCSPAGPAGALGPACSQLSGPSWRTPCVSRCTGHHFPSHPPWRRAKFRCRCRCRCCVCSCLWRAPDQDRQWIPGHDLRSWRDYFQHSVYMSYCNEGISIFWFSFPLDSVWGAFQAGLRIRSIFGRILQIRILKSYPDPDPRSYRHLKNQFKHLNFFHIKHISSNICMMIIFIWKN